MSLELEKDEEHKKQMAGVTGGGSVSPKEN